MVKHPWLVWAMVLILLGAGGWFGWRWYSQRPPKWPRAILFSPLASGDAPSHPQVWHGFTNELGSNLVRYANRKLIPAGIHVEMLLIANNSAQLEKMRGGGGPHILALGSGATLTAFRDPRCHYLPAFTFCDESNRPIADHAVFIVSRKCQALDQCTSVGDLVRALRTETNVVFGLGDNTSQTGNWIPRLVLGDSPSGVLNDRNTLRLPSHGDLIVAVADNGIQAACVASDALARHERIKRVKPLDWTAETEFAVLQTNFPSVSIGWRDDLPAALQTCIAETLESHDWRTDDSFRTAFSDFYRTNVTGVRRIERFFETWDNVIENQEASSRLLTKSKHKD